MGTHFLSRSRFELRSVVPDRSKTQLTIIQLDAYIIGVYFPHIAPTILKKLTLVWSCIRVYAGKTSALDHLVPEHGTYCKTYSTKEFGWSIEIGLAWS